MRILKQILIKTAWLILYLGFNIGLFFIELNVYHEKKFKSGDNNSGIAILDISMDIGDFFSSVFEKIAIFVHINIDLCIALVAFLLFIPIQFRYIKPKYKKGSKKKFLYSVLASLLILMILKLIMYIWVLIDAIYF